MKIPFLSPALSGGRLALLKRLVIGNASSLVRASVPTDSGTRIAATDQATAAWVARPSRESHRISRQELKVALRTLRGDWRREEPRREVRETSMNDVMAVILFILGSVWLALALRAWARSRHREITIADRLLASLVTAGQPPARRGGKPCSG